MSVLDKIGICVLFLRETLTVGGMICSTMTSCLCWLFALVAR